MPPMNLLELEERRIIEIDAFKELLESFSPVAGVEDRIAYASTPTRTGKRLIDAFKKHGVRNRKELDTKGPGIFIKEVWKPNIADAKKFVKELVLEGPGRGYNHVLDASRLHIKEWTPEHYMSLWKYIIPKEEINPLCFNNSSHNPYYFSLGSIEEYLKGLEHKKDLRGREGFQPLRVEDELEKFWQAIRYISEAGADPKKHMDFFRDIREYSPKKSYYNLAADSR
jgi:hypothetical protein